MHRTMLVSDFLCSLTQFNQNHNIYYLINDIRYPINGVIHEDTKLGEFEELVLLSVIVLREEAFGVEIKKELEKRMEERLSVGSIHLL